jgi:hypothetical protein
MTLRSNNDAVKPVTGPASGAMIAPPEFLLRCPSLRASAWVSRHPENAVTHAAASARGSCLASRRLFPERQPKERSMPTTKDGDDKKRRDPYDPRTGATGNDEPEESEDVDVDDGVESDAADLQPDDVEGDDPAR